MVSVLFSLWYRCFCRAARKAHNNRMKDEGKRFALTVTFIRPDSYPSGPSRGRLRILRGLIKWIKFLIKKFFKLMRRRGRLGGMGSVRRKEEREKQFEKVGMSGSMGAAKLEHVEEQLQLFRINLENFARKYKDNIRKDPSFRREFQIMCAKIGVDPLASTKGFWAEILGVGTFYTELGVQIVDACVSTRTVNGGLIEVSALIRTVQKMRGSNALDISGDDVERAVKQLRVLGSGFNVVQAGAKRMVVSVPVELNQDHSLLLYASQGTGGYITLEVSFKSFVFGYTN